MNELFLVDEPAPSEYDVSCHTEGCWNAGHVLRVLGYGQEPMILCGPCGQVITDITPVNA